MAVILYVALPERAGRAGPAPGKTPRLLIVVRGEVDVILTDPRGRFNAVRDTGEVNEIPGCRRISDWNETDAAAPETSVTAFDLSAAARGLYAVRVRAVKPGPASVDVTASLEDGKTCQGKDEIAPLRAGERGTFSVSFQILGGEDAACRIEVGHRRPQEKKRTNP